MTSNVQSHCTHTTHTHTHTQPSSFHSLFQVFSFCFLALQIQDKTPLQFSFQHLMLYNTFHSSSLFLLTASCWHTVYLLCATVFMLHSLVIHFIYIFFPVHSLAGHFMCLLCGSFSCSPISSIFCVVHSSWDSLTPISTIFIAVHALMRSILSIFLGVHFLSLHSIYLLCTSFS